MAYNSMLHLSGPLAKEFKRSRLGETVKLTITARLNKSSVMEPQSVENGREPYAEFEVIEVDGGKKPYSEMSAGEMEAEMSDVYHNEQQPTGTSREDGGSIWTDIKEQEKVNRQPFTRPKPFAFR